MHKTRKEGSRKDHCIATAVVSSEREFACKSLCPRRGSNHLHTLNPATPRRALEQSCSNTVAPTHHCWTTVDPSHPTHIWHPSKHSPDCLQRSTTGLRAWICAHSTLRTRCRTRRTAKLHLDSGQGQEEWMHLCLWPSRHWKERICQRCVSNSRSECNSQDWIHQLHER